MECSLDLGIWESQEGISEENELDLDTKERNELHRGFKYEEQGGNLEGSLGCHPKMPLTRST